MDNFKIEQLRNQWGDKPCVHPALKKAKTTQDKVCTTCGRVVYSAKSKKYEQSAFDQFFAKNL